MIDEISILGCLLYEGEDFQILSDGDRSRTFCRLRLSVGCRTTPALGHSCHCLDLSLICGLWTWGCEPGTLGGVIQP